MAITATTKEGKKLYEVYVNGFDLRGRRIQRRKRGVESIRKAEEVEFEFHRELATLREEGVPYTWSDWLNTALSRMKLTLKITTTFNYECSLGKWVTPHWEDREIKSIKREDVYSVIFEKLDPDLSPHSRKNLLKYLKRVFQMAVEEGILDRNPALGIKVQVPEVDQAVLTNEEVKIFLREAKMTSHRFYPVWAMALMTGMRSGELYALNWTDIDFEARLISVSKQWTSKTGICPTKTKRSRLVPISDELALFLKEEKLKSTGENVLPHLKEWEDGTQAQVTREFCESIGITSVKFHDLRATFITNLLARGETLVRVMSIVGHNQLKTTNVYVRKAGIEIRGATDKLGYGVPHERPATILQLKI